MPSLQTYELLDAPTVRQAIPSIGSADPEPLLDDMGTRKIDMKVAIGDLRDSDPQVADRLEAAMAEMPTAGDEFLGFRLVLELGRGAFGRVFLAHQISLAERPVALKITADLNGESQRLARLQHTNIVPIYSEHRNGSLHAVCMPYFGSTTLSDVCKALRPGGILPTSGKHLISTLLNRQSTVRSNHDSHHSHSHDSHHEAVPQPISAIPLLPGGSASLTKIEEMSYVDAVLWIGARLADGLAHAHERGIIHRDLKPANVLLCDDGQPMLLDFNLAEDLKNRTEAAVAHAGGTLPYMAPEQLIVYRDGFGHGDGRGDVYALGLILFHLLTGQHAFPIRKGKSRTILPKMIVDRQTTPPSPRLLNRQISPAVESIIRHCLEFDPNARYASANEVAEDLERHRANLPLKFASETSLLERGVKWCRRHPKLASPTTFSALIAAVLLIAVTLSVHFSLKDKKRDLEVRREQALTRYYDFQNDYHRAQDLLTSDEPGQVAEGLTHGEKALRDYGVLDQVQWQEQPAVKELPPTDRARLKAEVGEIAFLLARAVHFQPQDDKAQALSFNKLAEENLDAGAQAALAQQRADLTNKALDSGEYLRLRQTLEDAAGLNNRGKFLLACEHAAQGRHREALNLADALVVQDPNDFGGWFLKARSHHALEQATEALAAYGTAIALRPNYPRSYVARAGIYYNQQTHLQQARADLDQAIRLKPDLLEAHIDRGLVLFALNKYEEALVDLDWAVEHPNVPARIWFIRHRVKLAMNRREEAEQDRLMGLRVEPTDPTSWVSRGMAKLSADDPDGALADFIQAEKMYPRCIDALHNQAYVYSAKMKRTGDAIASLERLLAYHPDNLRAIGYRSVLLARLGKFEEAVTEARRVLKMTVLPEYVYRAACTLALASVERPELRAESLKLLSQVLMRGWGHAQLEKDSDLAPLRETPEFKQFVSFTKLLKSLPALTASP